MSEDIQAQQFKSDVVYDSILDKKRVKNPKVLTKSKYLNGLQCPKLLWTRCNAPKDIPEPSEELQQVFNTGNRVGELAMTRFPGGVRVQQDDFAKNLKETKELLSAKSPVPIYEAGIMVDRIYARADILRPSQNHAGAWDVIEVKCGTECKDIYLQDIAFQKYTYEQSGLTIDRCFLMHVNNEYVRQGDIDVQEFFALLDVSIEIIPFYDALPKLIEGFLKIIDMPICPQISIREHCGNPYECQMIPVCWDFLPDASVMELYRGKAKGFNLLDQGITLLKDIPDDFKLTENQLIQRQCAIINAEHVDRDSIEGFLKNLEYPLYFLDFETMFECIPRFDGIRPYQQVPFQFSLHIQKSLGSPLEHSGFIHKNSDDPRGAFIKQLRACLEPNGTILVYNQGFEEGRLKELAEVFTENADWCHDVILKMADLLIPFRKFHYYHPKQQGSASLKKVLPVLASSSYEGMEISHGGQASSEYARVTYNDGVGTDEKQRVYTALEEYCGLDTKAMVDIVEKLRKF